MVRLDSGHTEWTDTPRQIGLMATAALRAPSRLKGGGEAGRA